MKKMTLSEFIEFANRTDWKSEENFHAVTIAEDKDEVYGTSTKTSALDGVTIHYQEGFSFKADGIVSLSAGTEGLDEPWIVEGVEIIGEDEDFDIEEICWDLPEKFREIDYSKIIAEYVTE